MKRIVLVLLALLVLLAIAGCGSSGPSDAAAYVGNVHTTLDETTFREVLDQMPPDIQGFFDMELNANMDRVYTWTFKDGSKMIFAFQPKGGEGAMQGLVLSWTDVKD